MRGNRQRRRPIPFRLTDPRGRGWSHGLPWRVTTAAGEPHDLSALQHTLLRVITWELGHGTHRLTLAELRGLTGAHRGSIHHALERLRSLNLIAYRTPPRGRHGHHLFWLPRTNAARAAARIRAERWPSRYPVRADPSGLGGNVVTPTTFGGFLSREGIRRAWRARERSGSPPVAAAPRRGASPAGLLRSRRRSWPPRYVDEACPRGGHRVRLELRRTVTDPPGDTAATWTGRCYRDATAIAVGMVLVRTDSGPSWSNAGAVAATLTAGRLEATADGCELDAASRPSITGRPSSDGVTTTAPGRPDPALAERRRRQAAAFLAEGLELPDADRVRVDHLGYRRRPRVLPPERPAFTSPRGGMTPDELEAEAWARIVADLEMVRDSRRLDLPSHEAPAARTITGDAILESDELGDRPSNERANLEDGRQMNESE